MRIVLRIICLQYGISVCLITIFSLFITGQTGKETFDDTDVGTIAEMALTKVIQMVKVQMADAMGGKKGAPQASRHTGSNNKSTEENLNVSLYIFMRNPDLNPVLLVLLKGNSSQK